MKTRQLQLIFIALTAAITAVLFCQYRLFYHDDAFISLRYVHNFLGGHGLVWNAGERVEGYSNFLWVMLVSVLGRLGIDLVVATRSLGIASFGMLVVYMARFTFCLQREDTSGILGLIPIIITATATPLIVWSLGGLETVLFTFLITAGMLQFIYAGSESQKSQFVSGVLLGLATLCRPDAILFVVLLSFCSIALTYRNARRFDRRVIWFWMGAMILVVPHEAFRYWYYGDFLPNTWYVKAANLPSVWQGGLKYLSEYAFAFPITLPLLLLAVLTSISRRALNSTSWHLLFVMAGYLLYIVSIGGDHTPAFRLIGPIIPLSGTLLWQLLVALPLLKGKAISVSLIGATVLLCGLQIVLPAEKNSRAKVTDGAAFLGMTVGKYIDINWPTGSVVALNTAGSTPYYAPKLRFIDMLGLNDTTIARRKAVPLRTVMQQWPGHGKGDGLYVLSRKPDYIIIGPANGDYVNDFPWFLSDYEISGSAEFERWYIARKVIIPSVEPGYQNYTESSLGTLRFVYYERKR